MTTRLLTLAALAIALAMPLAASAQGGPPPARVVVDKAQVQSLVQRRSVTGEIVSTRRSLVASQADGLVMQFDLNPGDTITAGDIIARLDDELATLQVEEARARLEAARGLVAQRTAELDQARRDQGRVERLAQSNSASASEVDDYETAVATTEAALAQAEADASAAQSTLSLAERRLRDKTITAPFTASVIAKSTEVGEWLGEGDPVVEIIALDALEARVDVPEHLLPYLTEVGPGITLRIPALGPNATVPAELIDLVPLGNQVSRIFTVRLRPRLDQATGIAAPPAPADPEGEVSQGALPDRLRPGMSITALVPTGTKSDFTTVHKDAIMRDDAGAFVYAALPASGGPPSDGPPALAATPVRVEILFAEGNRLAVRAPRLQPDTQIIVEGNERVFPTQPLTIINGERAAPDEGPGTGPEDHTPETASANTSESNG